MARCMQSANAKRMHRGIRCKWRVQLIVLVSHSPICLLLFKAGWPGSMKLMPMPMPMPIPIPMQMQIPKKRKKKKEQKPRQYSSAARCTSRLGTTNRSIWARTHWSSRCTTLDFRRHKGSVQYRVVGHTCAI